MSQTLPGKTIKTLIVEQLAKMHFVNICNDVGLDDCEFEVKKI